MSEELQLADGAVAPALGSGAGTTDEPLVEAEGPPPSACEAHPQPAPAVDDTFGADDAASQSPSEGADAVDEGIDQAAPEPPPLLVKEDQTRDDGGFFGGRGAGPRPLVLDEIGEPRELPPDEVDIASERVEGVVKRLLAPRLFVLCAPDQPVLRAFMPALGQHTHVAAAEVRWFHAGQEDVEAQGDEASAAEPADAEGEAEETSPVETEARAARLGRFADLQRARRAPGAGPLLLVIEAAAPPAQMLVDSLPDTQAGMDDLTGHLHSLDVWVVLLLHPSRLPPLEPHARVQRERLYRHQKRLALVQNYLTRDDLPDRARPTVVSRFFEKRLTRGDLKLLVTRLTSDPTLDEKGTAFCDDCIEVLMKHGLIELGRDRGPLFQAELRRALRDMDRHNVLAEERTLELELRVNRRDLQLEQDSLLEDIGVLEARGVSTKTFPGRPSIPFEEVDAVSILADVLVGTGTQRQRFDRQVASGRWGDAPEDIVKIVRDSHRRGELEQLIESLGDGSALLQPAAGELARLREASTLDLIVLFVASHFPDAEPEAFEAVLEVLIAGEAEIDVLTQPAPSPSEDDGEEDRVAPRPLGLAEQWKVHGDRILQEWDLEVHRQADEDLGHERQAVGWFKPGQFKRWADALGRHRHFLRTRLIRHLQSPSLMLDADGALFDRVLALLIEHVALSTRRRADAWLKGYVAALLPQAEPDHPESTSIQEMIGRGVVSAMLLGRMAIILREMLRRPELHASVRDCLLSLIRNPSPVARYFAFRLVRELRGASGFDEPSWWATLVEQGGPMIRKRVAQSLKTDVVQENGDVEMVLACIESWLPDPTKKPERLSQRNRVAMDLVLELVHAVTPEPGEVWPPTHPLFAAAPTADDVTPRAVAWMSHPWVQRHLDGYVRDTVQMVQRSALRPVLVANLADQEATVLAFLAGWAESFEVVHDAPEDRDFENRNLFEAAMLLRWMAVVLEAGQELEQQSGIFWSLVSRLDAASAKRLDLHWSALRTGLRKAISEAAIVERRYPGQMDAYAEVRRGLEVFETAAWACQRQLPAVTPQGGYEHADSPRT